MQIYTVKTGSVAVRSIASASAPITNILSEGSTIYVVDEDSGWLRTSGGKYIFKTDNLALSSPVRLSSSPTLRNAPAAVSLPGAIPTQPGAATVNPTTGSVGITVPKKTETPEKTEAEKDTEVSVQDTETSTNVVQNAENRNKQLSDTVATRKVEITSVVERDESGNEVSVPVPEGVRKGLRGVQVVTENGKDYLISCDPNDPDKTYKTELSYAVVETIDYKGKTSYKTGDELLTDSKKTEQEKQEETLLDQIADLGSKIIKTVSSINDLTVEDSRLIHGMPYQFMPIVDPRTVTNEEISAFNAFGRKYQEKIVARSSILYIQAGLPIFMRGYSDEAKEKMIESLVSQIESSGESELAKLLDDQNYQYYSFDEQSTLYFKAVNSACTALAHLLQIESVQINTLVPHLSDDNWGQTISDFLNPKSLGNINWALKTSNALGFYRGAVAFYINSDNQIQETFVNTPRASELANKINQLSDSATEAAYLMGGLGGNVLSSDLAASAGQTLMDMNKNIANGNSSKEYLGSSFIGSVINNISNLIAGGKMMFPEIWGDSQFQRSYNVTIKLDSPDSDSVSIFLNVLVPLVHILGFVLPRSAGPNMYASPFLVRCFYKSAFHIDMGIITSCSVTKGDTGAWNNDGLPTQITVELTIKDLYNNMAQSTGMGNNTLISNPAQLEYLANLAGVNVAPASFSRAIELWFAVKGINRMKQGLVGWGSDMIQGIYKKLYNLSATPRNQM